MPIRKQTIPMSFGTILHFLCQRRTILWSLGIIVCLYAVSVLICVQIVPDLGLKSAFNPILTNVRSSEDILPGPEQLIPQRGDEVLQVGDKIVSSWPDLLNAPSRIREEIDEGTVTLPTAWAKFAPNHPDRVLIKVRFSRDDEQSKKEFVAWCPLRRPPLSELMPALLWFMLKLLLFVVGVLVLWKRPDDPASVQFYVLCLATLGAYIGGYHWNYLTIFPILIVGFIIISVLLPPITLHFYLVFPRPKTILTKHKPWTLLGVYGLSVVILSTLLVEYFHLRGLYQSGVEAEVIRTSLGVFLGTILASLLVAGIWYLTSVVALLHSLIRAHNIMERNQVLCILVGSALSLIPIGYSLYLLFFNAEEFSAGGATWPMFAASVVVTASFIVGITRYRLMELDQIISSGAIYFFISFLVGVTYYGVVFLGTLVFNQVIASPPLADALRVSTVALVLMFVLDMARSRFTRALDRRFNREKYHLDRTLQRMGEAVEQLVDPPTLVQRLLHASADLLGVNRGAAYLHQRSAGGYRLAGWIGPAPAQVELADESWLVKALQRGAAVNLSSRSGLNGSTSQQLRDLGGEIAFPLTQDGQLLAILVLGKKANGSFRREDLNLLSAFAQITVLALGSAEGHEAIEQLNDDLQEKVEKISEQQRRIFALQSQLRRQDLLRGNAEIEANSASPSAERPDEKIDAKPATVSKADEDMENFCENIIGSGSRVRQLLRMVGKVSRTEAVVLIRGESGTGKELLAEAIHQNSRRAGKTFVKVHCAALSATLLESELFGHVKGAFTSAHRDKVGRFELANGGTLFLDEIGDISLEVQTKLLRVLQERTFERVGSSESVKADVRIVAATHQNLEELIRQGRFREDLYYRLNVFPVLVPPLRSRREDIPELTLHFLTDAARRCGKTGLQFDDDALAVMKMYDWPGNVRQLENVIERAVVLVEGKVISVGNLPEELRSAAPFDSWRQGSANNHHEEDAIASIGMPRSKAMIEENERQQILRALDAASGNKARAARALGIPRSTLVSRLKKYGVL